MRADPETDQAGIIRVMAKRVADSKTSYEVQTQIVRKTIDLGYPRDIIQNSRLAEPINIVVERNKNSSQQKK